MGIPGNTFLFIAGFASLVIAILHIAFVVVGPAAYRYFGAGETMARMAEEGSLFPHFLTLLVAGVFAVFALYGFSGSSLLSPLPFLRPALFLIGAIYTLRGLVVFYALYEIRTDSGPEGVKHLLFSLVALALGILYLAGWMAAQQEG